MGKVRLGDITGFTTPDPMVGTPGQDAVVFPGQQLNSDTCAIRSQEFIINQFIGKDIPEDTLVEEAKAHGWYDHGTAPEDVGKLLELHGIPVNRYEHANIFNLTSELAQGHKVIIGVDSEELWQQNPILHDIAGFFGFTGADHAVVVSGIDTTDPDHPKVVISDPGTGDAAKSYPLDQFVKAWQGGDFSMVSTQEPAPSHLPEMANFDYATGHIGNLGYADLLHSVGVSENTVLPHIFSDDHMLSSSDHINYQAHLSGSMTDLNINHHTDDSLTDSISDLGVHHTDPVDDDY